MQHSLKTPACGISQCRPSLDELQDATMMPGRRVTAAVAATQLQHQLTSGTPVLQLEELALPRHQTLGIPSLRGATTSQQDREEVARVSALPQLRAGAP